MAAYQRELALHTEEHALHARLAQDLRSDRFPDYLLEESFQELAAGASQRLFELTRGRYELRHAGGIEVIDHDNAGEARSSDTLSGGETFLASLALALELSEQVQRTSGAVRLDSLFIDEGFGTLDAETLQTACEIIQGLRSGGRMVGIITHIADLRDEFELRIQMTKGASGSSARIIGRDTAV